MPWSEISLALLAAVFSVTAARGQEASEFTVGILEASGNLIPVATFDGSDWSNPWPLDFELGENAPVWPALPEHWIRGGGSLEAWTLWIENPASSSTAGGVQSDWVTDLSTVDQGLAAHGLVTSSQLCSRNLALATNAGDRRRSLIRCEYCCPEPKRGIATNSRIAPELVERLEAEDEQGGRVIGWARDVLDALEENAIARDALSQGVIAGRLRHTGQWLDADRRRAAPLQTSTFRVWEPDASVYFVEITRNYGPFASTPGIDCPGFSALRAWVATDTHGKPTSLEQQLALVDCDGKGSRSDTPVVYWRHGTAIDILVRSLGYETEDYLILRVEAGELSNRASMSFRR